jgi:hypothetical protein
VKIFKFVFRCIVIGIVSTPALSLSMPVFAADGGQTPGTKVPPTDTEKRNITPYVPPADVYVPESSKAAPGDAGKSGHTNILIQKPSGNEPEGISDLSQPEPPAKQDSNTTFEKSQQNK